MSFRSLGRYTLTIIVLSWTAWPPPTRSAEITCATVWSVQGLPSTTTQTIEEAFRRRFPSGLRPVPGTTCLTGVLRGTIVQGDDERVARFYRANHPFLDK